jgi:hypothetical protein
MALESVMQSLKTEATYFFPDGGQRVALLVFDVADESGLVTSLEPLWNGLRPTWRLSPR